MGVEVFQCYTGNSLKRLFDKKDTNKMYIQLDDTKSDVTITGKAYIANEDGKNEYISQFEHFAKDITNVKKGEFQGGEALILNLKISTMYGSKKIQIIVPNLGSNLNRALDCISNYVKQA